jgi:isopentenyldiphosphate isomerase
MDACERARQEWLAALRERAAAPPLAPRFHLLAGAPAARIGSIEAGLAERLCSAGLLRRESASQWCVEAPIDPGLAAIARWLREQGIAGPWRDELLCVTDPQLQPLGSIERAAVRPLGIATFAVHLVAARSDGTVWVQQRASNKATDPGLWDTTMGGQVGAGESVAQALERETWEEAGLRRPQLQGLRRVEAIAFRRPVAEGYLVETIDVYEATLADTLAPKNQDGEVQGFDCLAPDALWERLLDEQFTLEAAVILAAWLQRREIV